MSQLDKHDYLNIAVSMQGRAQHLVVEDILNEQIAKNRSFFNNYLAKLVPDQLFQRNKLQTIMFLNCCWKLQMANSNGFTVDGIIQTYQQLFKYYPAFRQNFVKDLKLSDYIMGILNHVLNPKASDSAATLQKMEFNPDLSFSYTNSVNLQRTVAKDGIIYRLLSDDLIHYLVMSYEAYVDDVAGVSMDKILDKLQIENAKPDDALATINDCISSLPLITTELNQTFEAIKKANPNQLFAAEQKRQKKIKEWQKQQIKINATVEKCEREIRGKIKKLHDLDSFNGDAEIQEKVDTWNRCLQAYNKFNQEFAQIINQVTHAVTSVNYLKHKYYAKMIYAGNSAYRKLDSVVNLKSLNYAANLVDLLMPIIKHEKHKMLNPALLLDPGFTPSAKPTQVEAKQVTILTRQEQIAKKQELEQKRQYEAAFITKFCSLLRKNVLNNPVLISQIIKQDKQFEQLFKQDLAACRKLLFLLGQHPSCMFNSDVRITENQLGFNWSTIEHLFWKLAPKNQNLNFINSKRQTRYQNLQFTDLICYVALADKQDKKEE